MNQQVKSQIYDGLRVLLAAGGPGTAIVLRYTHMNPSDFQLFVQLALFVVPPMGSWAWGLYLNTIAKKVEAIAEQPAHVQEAALTQVSDATKILIAEGVPSVATVVVKDVANGAIGTLAQSASHPSIVTETQNELDAKAGKRTVAELASALDSLGVLGKR